MSKLLKVAIATIFSILILTSCASKNNYDEKYLLAQEQYDIGYSFEMGEGKEKDYKKAFEWYKKSADQGFAKAQNQIGNMYVNGQGIEKDYKKAFEWYKKSANQGNKEAQYNIGLSYKKGQGVDKDLNKAFKWFKKSADQGNKDAQKSIDITCNEFPIICSNNKIKSQADIFLDSSQAKSYYYEYIKPIDSIVISLLTQSVDKKNEDNFNTIAAFYNKYLLYEKSIRPKLIEIISKNFTDDELLEINIYNNSQIGKKSREKMLELVLVMQTTATKFVEKNKEALQKMIEQRTIEIKDNKEKFVDILAKNMTRDFEFKSIKEDIKNEVNTNKTQAEILFDKPIYEEIYYKGVQDSLDEQVKLAPQLLMFKDVLEEWILKYMNYEEVKPSLVKVFNENFTQEELSKINEFESTKLGEKYNKQIPDLYKEIKSMSKKFVEEYKEDLKKIIESKVKSK